MLFGNVWLWQQLLYELGRCGEASSFRHLPGLIGIRWPIAPASQLKSSSLQRKQIGMHGSLCFPTDAGLRQVI